MTTVRRSVALLACACIGLPLVGTTAANATTARPAPGYWLAAADGGRVCRSTPRSMDQEPCHPGAPGPCSSTPSRRALCPEDLDAVQLIAQSPATMVIGCSTRTS